MAMSRSLGSSSFHAGAADQDVALRRVLQPRDHAHRGGLAAARGAEQPPGNSPSAMCRFIVCTPTNCPQALGQVLQLNSAIGRYPFTAPAVRPLTIWRWKNITRMNNSAVTDTTEATANITFAAGLGGAEEASILGTMVSSRSTSSFEVTAKSL